MTDNNDKGPHARNWGPQEEFLDTKAPSKDKSEMKQESSKPNEKSLMKSIDKTLSELPSAGFVIIAAATLTASAGLALWQGKRGWATFVGLWVPSLLFLGVYSKLTSLERSNREPEKVVH